MEVTANLLPLAGLTLGIRHGFDLDHTTAINDHALVVITLGLGVLVFCASLPAWIDPIIGALHGIGAETGTQFLLMTSIVGSNSIGWSLLMLASFVTGMFIANIGLALAARKIATGATNHSIQ